MKTILFLTTLWVCAQHATAKCRAFGVPRSLVTFVTTIPRGGQRGYEYHDYEDSYKNPPQDRYTTPNSANPDYYNEDYYGRPEEDRGFEEDRGYYDDRGTPSTRPRDDDDYETGGVMSKFKVPDIIKTGNRKIGLPLLGIGAALTVLGISLFFNKALMRLGNLFFVAGVPMTIGPGRTAGYFFQPTKARATGCLALGIFLVFVGWPVLGIVLEVFGFLNLFGNMFPVAMAVLKTMPVIGPLLRGEAGAQSRKRRYSGDDEDDFYGGVDRGYDDRRYYDELGGKADDFDQRYY